MGYDFSKSDLFMMVGGQIALLVLVILVVWFGVGPLQFAYANDVEKMLNGINSSTNVAANAKSVVSVANAKSVVSAPIVKNAISVANKST